MKLIRGSDHYLFSILIIVTLSVLFFFRNTGLIIDEIDNYQQIMNFSNGNFTLLEISAMPGYHLLMSIPVIIGSVKSVFALRVITVIFGIICLMLFYAISMYLKSGYPILRTVQFFSIPIITIYYYLIYTDIASLMFVLLMVYFGLRKNTLAAGIAGILSMLIRQNNVIWLLLIPAIDYIDRFGWKMSLNGIRIFAGKYIAFIAGILLFVLFVVLNKGVAIGDSSSHPDFRFSTGNLYFMLFCLGVLFLPLHISNIKLIISRLNSDRMLLLYSAVLIIVYWFLFNPDHPYNKLEPQYFIRNLILVKTASLLQFRIIFLIVILITFWSLYVTAFIKKSLYMLYPLTILFLSPSWLIEQRYYIIPIVLFLLFRKESDRTTEYAIMVYNLLLLALLIPLVSSGKAFL